MPNFAARVELHSATYNDYETLHVAMAQRGYARTIVGDDKATYQLPTATYVAVNSSAPLAQALNAAKAAADSTGRTSSIIVFEYIPAQWIGLPKV